MPYSMKTAASAAMCSLPARFPLNATSITIAATAHPVQ